MVFTAATSFLCYYLLNLIHCCIKTTTDANHWLTSLIRDQIMLISKKKRMSCDLKPRQPHTTRSKHRQVQEEKFHESPKI